ncbi:MAG: heavy-metal-associated domain-containing protein [Ignavibacteriaceae bacterium]
MKNVLSLFILILSFIFSACGDEPEEIKAQSDKGVKKDSINRIFMTRETSIKAAEYLTAEIKIPTAVCNMCEKNIIKAVKKLNGVVEAFADADKKVAKVTFDGAKTTTERIRTAISRAGYDADNIKRDSSAYNNLDECCKI